MWQLSESVGKVIESDPTASLLVQAVKSAPAEDAPASQLVDRLQELGVRPTTARSYVRLVRLLVVPVDQWPVDVLRKLVRGTTVGAIAADLGRANGLRKKRTVTLGDCLYCVLQARVSGKYTIGGGTVANSYGYPAFQTGVCAAVSSTGRIRVVVGAVVGDGAVMGPEVV